MNASFRIATTAALALTLVAGVQTVAQAMPKDSATKAKKKNRGKMIRRLWRARDLGQSKRWSTNRTKGFGRTRARTTDNGLVSVQRRPTRKVDDNHADTLDFVRTELGHEQVRNLVVVKLAPGKVGPKGVARTRLSVHLVNRDQSVEILEGDQLPDNLTAQHQAGVTEALGRPVERADFSDILSWGVVFNDVQDHVATLTVGKFGSTLASAIREELGTRHINVDSVAVGFEGVPEGGVDVLMPHIWESGIGNNRAGLIVSIDELAHENDFAAARALKNPSQYRRTKAVSLKSRSFRSGSGFKSLVVAFERTGVRPGKPIDAPHRAQIARALGISDGALERLTSGRTSFPYLGTVLSTIVSAGIHPGSEMIIADGVSATIPLAEGVDLWFNHMESRIANQTLKHVNGDLLFDDMTRRALTFDVVFDSEGYPVAAAIRSGGGNTIREHAPGFAEVAKELGRE